MGFIITNREECPKCGSFELNDGDDYWEGDNQERLIRPIECNDCGYEFEEVFDRTKLEKKEIYHD